MTSASCRKRGVRDLPATDNDDIVAGRDGGIWLLRPRWFLRLGRDAAHRWATQQPEHVGDFEVAPDGTVWTVQGPEGDGPTSAIRSFDGER